MPLIPRLVEKLQRHPKRFVFPEGADPRVIQSARQIVTRRMGAPILLGERSIIKDAALRRGIRKPTFPMNGGAGQQTVNASNLEDSAEFSQSPRENVTKPCDSVTVRLV